jgi:hypothetical protein
LNEDVEVIRLLWLAENFFEYDRHFYHEIAFYFLMQFRERSSYLVKDQSFWGIEEGTKMEFKWFPIDYNVLKQLPLLPSFLQESLSNLPTSVEHIIQRDR